ncbi:MAG: hypothetical protein WC712_10970 [Candidatus Brocadiia bacterium]
MMLRNRILLLLSIAIIAILAVMAAAYLSLSPRPVPTPKAGESVSPSPQPSTAFTKPKWFPIEDCAVGVEMKKQTPEAYALLTSQSCVKPWGFSINRESPCNSGILPDGSFVTGQYCYDAADGVCRWRCPITDEDDYSMYLDAGRNVGYYRVAKSLYRADFAKREWALVTNLADLVIPSEISSLGEVEIEHWRLLLVRNGSAYFSTGYATGTAVLKLELEAKSITLWDIVSSEGPSLDDADPLAPDSYLCQFSTSRAFGPPSPAVVIRDLSRPGVPLLEAKASFCSLRSSDGHIFLSNEEDNPVLVEMAPGPSGYTEVGRYGIPDTPVWLQFDAEFAYFWPGWDTGQRYYTFRLPGMERVGALATQGFFPVGVLFGGRALVQDRGWVNVLDWKTGQFQFPACTGSFAYTAFALAGGTTICCWLDRNKAQIWDYATDEIFSIPLPPDLQAERVWYNPALPGFVVEMENNSSQLDIRLIEGEQPATSLGPATRKPDSQVLVEHDCCSMNLPQPPALWPGTTEETPSRGVFLAGKVFRLENGAVLRYAAGGGKEAFAAPAPVEHYAPVTETVILADKNLVNLAGKVLAVGECYAMPEALIYTDPVHNKWVRLGKDGSFHQITKPDAERYPHFVADIAGTGDCVISWGLMDDLLLCKWQPREPDETDRQIADFLGWGK